MNANELRIGNLVIIDNDEFWSKLKDLPFIVHSITPNLSINLDKWSYSIGLISMNEKENYVVPLYSQLIDFIKPIPLTDGWLLKFGFKNIENQYFTIDDIISFSLNLKVSYLLRDNYIDTILYVHQLQNLYFALTGQELTLNS